MEALLCGWVRVGLYDVRDLGSIQELWPAELSDVGRVGAIWLDFVNGF